MRCSPCKPFSWITLIAVLTLLLSGWTCSGMFVSCQGVSQAQITSLSPGKIPSDVNSVPLTVAGNGFTPRSQITWNGSTGDHVSGLTPRSGDDYSGDLGILRRRQQCADFCVSGFGMSYQREFCRARSSHQLEPCTGSSAQIKNLSAFLASRWVVLLRLFLSRRSCWSGFTGCGAIRENSLRRATLPCDREECRGPSTPPGLHFVKSRLRSG